MSEESSSILSDYNLWQSFKYGDESSLSAIFMRFSDDLFNYGKKLTTNPELTKDLLQDLFYKLWKNRSGLKDLDLIKPYLLRAFRTQLIDYTRKEKKLKEKAKKLEENYEFESITFSYEDFLINEQLSDEQNKKLTDLLNTLPARQKEAIFLKYFEELEYKEIADVMKMNVQSVRNLICQAIKVMKSSLEISVAILYIIDKLLK